MPEPTAQEKAEAYVKEFAAWQAYPELSAGQITICVEAARLRDSAGRLPDSVGYVFTYSPNLAIVLSWELKAAKVAGRFSTVSGGQSLQRKEAFDNCLAMIKMYKNKCGITSVVGYGAVLAAAARRAGLPLEQEYGNFAIIDASDVDGGEL